MDNETIVLYTEDKELLKEVRQALIEEGFEDMAYWNNSQQENRLIDRIYVWGLSGNYYNRIQYHNHNSANYPQHHLSRTDFLTMFLLG